MTTTGSSFERISPKRFLRDAGGATAIEYALIGGLVALGLIGGVSQFADNYNKNASCVDHAINGDEATHFCSGRGA